MLLVKFQTFRSIFKTTRYTFIFFNLVKHNNLYTCLCLAGNHLLFKRQLVCNRQNYSGNLALKLLDTICSHYMLWHYMFEGVMIPMTLPPWIRHCLREREGEGLREGGWEGGWLKPRIVKDNRIIKKWLKLYNQHIFNCLKQNKIF